MLDSTIRQIMRRQNLSGAHRGLGRTQNLIAFLIGCLTLGMLAACTGPAEPASTPASVSSSASPHSQQSLKMLWYGNAAEETLLRQQLLDSQLNVELTVVPADQLEDTLDHLITTDRAPDVVRTASPASHWAELKAIDQITVEDFLVGLDWSMMRGKEVVSVPYSTRTSLVVVNADLFEAAGIALPTSDFPWKSWDRMLVDAAQAAQQPWQPPIPASQPLVALDQASPLALDAYLWQRGLSYYDEKRGGSAWDIELGTKTLADLTRAIEQRALANTFELDATTTPAKPKTSARALFESASVPLLLTDSSYQPATNFKTIWLPDPCQEQCGPMPGADFLVNFGAHPQADQLINYLTSPSAQIQRAEIGALPTRRQVLNEMQQWPVDRLGPAARVAVRELELTHPAALATGFSPARPLADQKMTNALAGLVAGTSTPKRASEVIGRGSVTALSQSR